VAQGDFRNQQLTALVEFAEPADGCSNEREIVECFKTYISRLLPQTEGAIYRASDKEESPTRENQRPLTEIEGPFPKYNGQKTLEL
jgi:hypothetical protein